jgi:transposase
VGSDALLSAALHTNLQTQMQRTAAFFARWVAETFGVDYTMSGTSAVLRPLGYAHRKTKLVRCEADAERPEEHIRADQDAKDNEGEDDVILFMDATHPLHNPVSAGAWIKRGTVARLPSNTGRARLDINGAIDVASVSTAVRIDDNIHAASTIALFEQTEAAYPSASTITVIRDNARFHRWQDVASYLEDLRIHLLFLPDSSPNLNLIERFWELLNNKVN